MPGFAGTGPRGMGPMTGGARGYCVEPAAGRFARSLWRRPAAGMYGAGFFGRGRSGAGMGRGVRGGWAGPSMPPVDAMPSRDQQMELLREQAAGLRSELDAIERRISELGG